MKDQQFEIKEFKEHFEKLKKITKLVLKRVRNDTNNYYVMEIYQYEEIRNKIGHSSPGPDKISYNFLKDADLPQSLYLSPVNELLIFLMFQMHARSHKSKYYQRRSKTRKRQNTTEQSTSLNAL